MKTDDIYNTDYINIDGNHIHTTAIINKGVKLGKGNWIGAYTVIGSNGEIRGVNQYDFSGTVEIGDNNIISEHVTIQRPFEKGAKTVIGNNKMKIEIFITTYNRPEWCLNLLSEIESEFRKFDYNCRVWHDYNNDKDYSEVKKFCKGKDNFFYYKSKKHFGKSEFWKFNNLMYAFLDTLKYDYYFQLVDDITLARDFTERALSMLVRDIDVVNLGFVNVHEINHSFVGCRKKYINSVEIVETNWADCLFVAKKKAMTGLRLNEPPPHRIKDIYLGSGTGQMFIKAYNEKSNKKIWQTRYALFEHLGANATVMHTPDRKNYYYAGFMAKGNKDPLRMLIHEKDFEYLNRKFKILTNYIKIKNMYKNTVDVFIASLPQRRFLNNTVNSILLEPEVANIYCFLNNYNKSDVDYLIKNEKVHYIKRNNEKGCTERFWNIGKFATNKYIAFADDDFTITPNYFYNLIEAAEKYKALVSYHGCIMKPKPIKNYYKDRIVYHCRRKIENDTEVDIIGCGASLVEKKLLKGIDKYYNSVVYPNMDDIYYSALAKANGIKRIVVKHNEGVIVAKPPQETDDYIFDNLRNNCQPQTDFVNKYF